MNKIISKGFDQDIPGNLEIPCSVERLPNGNTLIADGGDDAGFGSEIIEVDLLGNIVWNYREGIRFAHSARRLKSGNTLITDTTNNRIIEVTHDKEIVMNSNDWGNGTGKMSDGSHLHYPNEAFEMEDGTFLVTDRNNNRCIQVDRSGRVIWAYDKEIQHPHNGRPLDNGNVLICDSDGNRIIEVNQEKEVVWSYGDGSTEMLWWPRGALRLENGNTLITDSKIGVILEVSPEGKIVWKWQTEHYDEFYICETTGEDTILISSCGNHQVYELDRSGNIVWLFRNYRRPFPIYNKLNNGFFKELTSDGVPDHWILGKQISEGGGKIIWNRENKPRPCPGLEYDRPGLLTLHQNINVEPGQVYKAGAEIKTVDVQGSAGFVMNFFDIYGNSLFREIPEMPMGELFTGTNDWSHDSFEAQVPARSSYMVFTLFINDSGKVFTRNLMLHRV